MLITVGLQVLINLLVVTGLAPTKGIALPFISSGGSGWVTTGLVIGLLLSIERNAMRRERALGITEDGALLVDADTASDVAGQGESVVGA